MSVVVATFAKVFAEEKYGMLPTTAWVEVPRPRYENAPEELLYASGKVAESEVEETLLLNVVQSVEERRPRFVAEAVGRLRVSVLP
ncbi:MAG: hypothetical protein KGI73_01640, partial [Patescibacteria group bacterium]|nr:hypothetical protein [Patescibacteria group bacterium]